jgi:hypothetical protein
MDHIINDNNLVRVTSSYISKKTGQKKIYISYISRDKYDKYDKNKDYHKKTITCSCGRTINKYSKPRHLKTKKHIKRMKQIEEQSI